MFASVFVFAAVAMTAVAVATMLASAAWPGRAPAAAIMLWQAFGLGWGLAAVGTLAALAARPEHAGRGPRGHGLRDRCGHAIRVARARAARADGATARSILAGGMAVCSVVPDMRSPHRGPMESGRCLRR